VDYSELIAEVTARTGDSTVATRAALFTALAETALSKMLRVGAAEKTVTLTTDADGVATLPSAYGRLREIRYAGYPLPVADVQAIQAKTQTGYYMSGGDIITSLPDAPITLYYYEAIPPLSYFDTNWLSDAEPEIYIYAVMKQVFAANLDTEKAAAADAMLTTLVDNFIRADAVARFSKTQYTPPGINP
jgi:hypothetical protein